MNSTTLHETIVRDIIDFMDDIKDSDLISHFKRTRKNDFKSISSKTEGLTLVFPVITSTNVDITTASMIAKAQERQAVSMLQLLFSAVSFNSAEDGFDYIKKFHTNLNYEKMTVDDFIDVMDKAVKESGAVITNKEQYKKVCEDLRNLNFYFEDDISESSLNDYRIIKGYAGNLAVIKESPKIHQYKNNDNTNNFITRPNIYDYMEPDRYDNDGNLIPGRVDNSGYTRAMQTYDDSINKRMSYNQRERELNKKQQNWETDRNDRLANADRQQQNWEKERNDRLANADRQQQNWEKERNDRLANADRQQQNWEKEREYRTKQDQLRNELDFDKYSLDRRENERRSDRDDFNDNREIITKRLIDNDVKKANELVPTLMYVNFTQENIGTDGKPMFTNQQMIIGVKCKIYVADSTEIMKRIILKNQDNNGLLKLIKATTREISFVKDFLFAIDRAKLDAKTNSKRGSSSKLFKVLERRANRSKFKRAIGKQNDAAAISTIHITKDEVEMIKKTSNIDLTKPQVVRKIMESYNLMSFVYSDDAVESASFIYDTGDDYYDTMSYNSLEREASDNSAKKVINLMTKMSR